MADLIPVICGALCSACGEAVKCASSCAKSDCAKAACDCPGELARRGVDCCQRQWCSNDNCCATCLQSSCQCIRSRSFYVPCADAASVQELCDCANDICWLNWMCNCSQPLATGSYLGGTVLPDSPVFYDVCCCPYCAVSRQWNAFRGRPDECDASKCLAAIVFMPCLTAALRHRVFDRFNVAERGCVSCCTGVVCPLCSLCATHFVLSAGDQWPGTTCCKESDEDKRKYRRPEGSAVANGAPEPPVAAWGAPPSAAPMGGYGPGYGQQAPQQAPGYNPAGYGAPPSAAPMGGYGPGYGGPPPGHPPGYSPSYGGQV